MDNLSKSSLNFLTAAGLDRMPEPRRSPGSFDELIELEKALFLPVWGEKILLREGNSDDPLFLAKHELDPGYITRENCFLLGRREGNTYFVIDVEEMDTDRFIGPGDFAGLRKSRIDLKNWKGAMLAYATALVSWHRNNRFCGRCGHPTVVAELGQARYCTDSLCALPHYPRTDPAIIVAVTRGDKCLMARKDGWPDEMYSVVAGYVDHGESLEDTVVREVFEETGIHVRNVKYHSSQPWPFPYTLMLGYFAEAENEEIQIDNHELSEARWFSRQDIIKGLKEGTHRLPSHFSISRKLITDWFNSGEDGKLEDFLP